MKKTHLSKPDFSGFTHAFGFVGLVFGALCAYQAYLGQSGEAFGLGFIAAILLIASVGVAIWQRMPDDTLRVVAAELPSPLPSARALTHDSCLDPESEINRDRIKNPPLIG